MPEIEPQKRINPALSLRSGVSMALLSLSALVQSEEEMGNHYQKCWEFIELRMLFCSMSLIKKQIQSVRNQENLPLSQDLRKPLFLI